MSGVFEIYTVCIEALKSKGLSNFDPKENYKLTGSEPQLSVKAKQCKMGQIANLVADMAVKGATEEELERAIRYSMVLMDSVKHNLDYKQSYKDEGIAELEDKYKIAK